MLFQMMFAIITPARITGAVAERIKFKAYVLFVLLGSRWFIFRLCHMVCMQGRMILTGRWLEKFRCWISRAAPVVHISSGVSALVCAIVLGKAYGYPHQPMILHNVVLSLIGTVMLSVGLPALTPASALECRNAHGRAHLPPRTPRRRRRLELDVCGMVAQRHS